MLRCDIGMREVSLEGMGLFVVVLKRVELPCPGSYVCFAVGGNVMSSFILGCELSFGFWSAIVLSHIGIGIRKDSRVVFLLGGLILLVGFFASAIELFAVTCVKVAGIFAIGFASDLLESGRCFYSCHCIWGVEKYIIYKYII